MWNWTGKTDCRFLFSRDWRKSHWKLQIWEIGIGIGVPFPYIILYIADRNSQSTSYSRFTFTCTKHMLPFYEISLLFSLYQLTFLLILHLSILIWTRSANFKFRESHAMRFLFLPIYSFILAIYSSLQFFSHLDFYTCITSFIGTRNHHVIFIKGK